MGKTKSLIRVEVTEIVVTPQEISIKSILTEFIIEYTENKIKSKRQWKEA